MSSKAPYYRRRIPMPQTEADFASDGTRIDLSRAHMDPYGTPDPVAVASSLFDRRAAAVVRAAVAVDGVGDAGPVSIFPNVTWKTETKTDWSLSLLGILFGPAPVSVTVTSRAVPQHPWFVERNLLELKWYDDKAPGIYVLRSKCLSAMAYLDYFPSLTRRGRCLRALVSGAVVAASPGWCGSVGPTDEGNYDMSQMAMVALAYGYYDDLSSEAQEHLITQLLGSGAIMRTELDDGVTNGGVDSEWRASGLGAGETENHILMILTVRYLVNQLLFPRTHDDRHDNRRNGDGDLPSCLQLLLHLLRDVLRADFSEYNAKPYQEETRWALLNLCSYAYDHEVRLAARMVLDYVSAHFAVSSNDLRRMVPFRRRNEGKYVEQMPRGFMDIGLLAWERGADPLTPYFAVQAGNVRAYQPTSALRDAPRAWEWGIRGSGNDLAMEVLTDYRLPALIHDLLVNDAHRRFFQRLRRTDPPERIVGHTSGVSEEIYACSPSYLITAGGQPTTWAIDPRFSFAGVVIGDQDQQLGVAVTTSFMPTGQSAGLASESDWGLIHIRSDAPTDASTTLIQFSAFDFLSQVGATELTQPFPAGVDRVMNYGVAPDFACGHQTYLPRWVTRNLESPEYAYTDESGAVRTRPNPPGFLFVNRGSPFVTVIGLDGPHRVRDDQPGFFLAIYLETEGGLGFLEAFDTWLHPHLSFEEFKVRTLRDNGTIRVANGRPARYRTQNGNRLEFVVWHDSLLLEEGSWAVAGAKVLAVTYGTGDPQDASGSGDAAGDQAHGFDFLRGTIINSPAEALVEISNPGLGLKAWLDMSDEMRPKRTVEDVASPGTSPARDVEQAGDSHEVWLDLDWTGLSEGDVCRPFASIASATAAVAAGGVIRIVPGSTLDRSTIDGSKPRTLVAPAGGVTIGGRPEPEGPSSGIDDEVWVDFDWTGPQGLRPRGDVLWPFDSITEAINAVAPGGVITIMPGITAARSGFGGGKPMTVTAPLGRVVLGRVRAPGFEFPGGIKPQ
jgi:hypothetical protein